MPASRRREPPFFHREQSKDQIESVAGLDPLFIYGGAGVTADRTGRTWSSLIALLLDHAGIPSSPATEGFLQDLGPLQGASAAVQALEASRGAANVDKALANLLRPNLYQDNDWRGGQLTRGMANLAIHLARLSRKACIATTNYDSFAMDDLGELVELSNSRSREPAIEVRQHNLQDPASELPAIDFSETGVIDFVQLHGLIPKDGSTTGYPVISESHYLQSRHRTEPFLTECFESANVLIVGSGLTDQPLLSALLATKDRAREKGLLRYAVITGVGVGGRDLAETEYEKICNLTRHRLAHFGVEPVFVDFYYQVGQFMTEVVLASGESAVKYGLSENRYGRRLMAWWEAWWKGTLTDILDAQQRHHEALVEVLDIIRSTLAVPTDEQLKLELWLRWDPVNGREFKLWASSFSRFSSHLALKTGQVEQASNYAAIRAFCDGRPRYLTSDELIDRDDRWKTYLAAPLVLPEAGLPVGSVVIASMTPSATSSISENRQGTHKRALELLNGAALAIAQPARSGA